MSADPADFFPLMIRKPRLLVFVAPAEFAALKATDERRFELKISGQPARRTPAVAVVLAAKRH